MSPITRQYHIVAACFLGWALDAFDFFIMIFVLSDIAREFGKGITAVTWAITFTLLVRAIGAIIFGQLGDRFGRKPLLMLNLLMYSIIEFASGFAPSLTALIVLRTLFGIAMGGEWGLGASLMMESIPKNWRGTASGILQAGYPVGYLLAAVLYWIVYPAVNWRGLFMIGAIPAFLLIFYIWAVVPESPAWKARPKSAPSGIIRSVRFNMGLFIYAVLVMTAFNLFSHSTQDLYPNAFLQGQHGLSPGLVATVAIIYNIGAICGCVLAGTLSQRFGRRNTIVVAAVAALVIVPFWAFASGVVWLALTAFLMQFAVQAAYGVVPAHLNEISPGEVRSTFPGLTSQLGNLLAAGTATLQSTIADGMNHNYSVALASTAAVGAVAVAILTRIGREAPNADLIAYAPEDVAPAAIRSTSTVPATATPQ